MFSSAGVRLGEWDSLMHVVSLEWMKADHSREKNVIFDCHDVTGFIGGIESSSCIGDNESLNTKKLEDPYRQSNLKFINYSPFHLHVRFFFYTFHMG